MDHWEHIRSQARAYHTRMHESAANDISARVLFEAAADATGIKCIPVHAGDPLLDGGEAVLDREFQTIWFNADIEPHQTTFLIAHEYAHLWLHGVDIICGQSDIDDQAAEAPIQSNVQQIEGYSPEERKEREANVFAREFLLPTDLLRQWYLCDGLEVATIATRIGVMETMVFHQLARILLVPAPLVENILINDQDSFTLDTSQQRAAHAEKGPLLIEAGPGTGKTRALVGRIAFLLNQNVNPSSILALTFSNKAAEEMRERISQIAPEAAQHIWMGTFHAFGLELLRKFGTYIGLPPKPQIIDKIEALFLLERLLPTLQLEYYQTLHEPITHLGDLLSAISRAKDELVSPAKYMELAERMYRCASSKEEQEIAEKAREVAYVYSRYQEHLEQQHLLDFGDIIFRAVTLLTSHADVRTFAQQTYTYILVDEYQDVNRASGLLLREIAGSGTGLWVVGDVRQAIYRFRGAAPGNMRQFTDDFPHAKIQALKRNYRSQPAIVKVFATLATHMQTTRGTSFTPWEVERSDSDRNLILLAMRDVDAEGEEIACEIARRKADGIPYHDQAVLCRSHTALARIATRLETAGVPVLYLGDLFERSEIRDLLSLLSLACEGHGHGLIRVARFAEYQIPFADVKVLLELAHEHNIPFPYALHLAQDTQTISEQGKRGLALLYQHLDGLCYGTGTWSMLARYLFVHSQYLRLLFLDTSISGQQRKLAIFQFLQFAHEQGQKIAEDNTDRKRTFLQFVRRLEIFGEDKQLRQLPEGTMNLDAVRLLTMHASKGLEFSVVYLPGLNRGSFPANRQWQPCPPPIGMLVPSMQDEHYEEEECLFFVALSRARDALCLSHTYRIGDRNSTPSSLLTLVESCLPPAVNNANTVDECERVANTPFIHHHSTVLPTFDVEALDLYLRCPRQYYYAYVLGLRGKRMDSGYMQFHHCIYGVLSWLQKNEYRVT